MKQSDLNKLRERDPWCWHCGTEHGLVPHHRANRGMGSSKILDTMQNVILVCAKYNGLMESDADVANEARRMGHKLSRYVSPATPVFDNLQKKWFALDTKGNKHETQLPGFIF